MSAPPSTAPRGRAALAGAVAAALALATGELLAGLVAGAPSPTVSVGDLIIALQPPGAKQLVVALFGEWDKIALGVATVLVVLAAGAGIGILRTRRPRLATAAILVLVGIGVGAGLRNPATSVILAAISYGTQATVGILVLDWLLGKARVPAARSATESPVAADAARSRRRFLAWSGGLGLLAVAGGGLGRRMLDGRAAAVTDTSGLIPDPVDPAASLPPDPATEVRGLTPFIVPTRDFYRIDTALVTPTVDVATWTLRVHGMVDRETVLSFEDLMELPLIERHVTIACVSNEVGGGLVGNATWTGVRLTDVLDMAGLQAGATQIVGRSVDAFTAGFPTSWVTERERDALIAVKMNGEPLTRAHGFPARLIIPGLYGYVSATKWLKELELTSMEAYDAYWILRGWAKEAPVLTQSRIDVPQSGATLAAGKVVIAGVAWAPDRGIRAVDVRVDEGPWLPATIIGEAGPGSWVQWKLAWDAPPGTHEIRVRAADGTGEVQTDRVTRPDPDGARGHHAIVVTVA